MSEIARRIGLSPSLFRRKLYAKYGKKLSEKDITQLQKIKDELQGWREGDISEEYDACLVLIEDEEGNYYFGEMETPPLKVKRWLLLKKF